VVWNDVGGAPAGGVEPGGAVLWAIAAAPAPSRRATAKALPKTAMISPPNAVFNFDRLARPEKPSFDQRLGARQDCKAAKGIDKND
jgi:hypothetical protein